MRKMISGLVAAVAVMAAAPAMACGYSGCWQPQVYVAPVATYGYSGCNSCGGGWGYGGGWSYRERLPIPWTSMDIAAMRRSNITTSTRARPIAVPATSRRARSIGKARSPAIAITATAAITARTTTAIP